LSLFVKLKWTIIYQAISYFISLSSNAILQGDFRNCLMKYWVLKYFIYFSHLYVLNYFTLRIIYVFTLLMVHEITEHILHKFTFYFIHTYILHIFLVFILHSSLKLPFTFYKNAICTSLMTLHCTFSPTLEILYDFLCTSFMHFIPLLYLSTTTLISTS